MSPSMLLVSPERVLHSLADPLFPHLVCLAGAILPPVKLYAGPLDLWVFASGGDWFVEGDEDEVEGDDEDYAEDLVRGIWVPAEGGHVGGTVQLGDVCRSFIWSLM